MAGAAPLAVFRPELKGRAIGILVYGVGGTVISLAVGLLGGVIAGALLNLAVGDTPSVIGGILIGLTLLIVLARFFIRGYRRGASVEVRIWPDRLERIQGATVQLLPFDALESLEHQEGAQPDQQRILLRREEGSLLEIAAPLPVAAIGSLLREVAIPVLVATRRAALERGEELVFREQQRRAYLGALGGLLAFLWGGFLTIGIGLAMSRGNKDVEPRGLAVGVLFLVTGISSLTWFVRTRGNGMILTRTGIRKVGRDVGAESPWSDLRRLTLSPIDVRLEGELLGRPLRLSRRAPNFLVLITLVAELAPDLEGVPR